MKIIISIITFLVLAFSSLHFAYAKEWRGITPLHSTSEDVDRLLGTPAKSSDAEAYFYDLGQEIVVIWFSSGVCKFGLGWNVPPGVVESLGVIPKGKLQARSLIADGNFKIRESGAGRSYYFDRKEGLVIEVSNGEVVSITYYSTAEDDERLHCPPKRESGFPHPRTLFDQYGNISFEDEKVRLDNYAIQLKNEPFMRGIIFAFGGRKGRAGEARVRAERAKNYLVKRRGIEAWRVTAVDGGYREDLTVELNIVTIGGWFASELDPVPTIVPSDVQIIKGSGVKKQRRRVKP